MIDIETVKIFIWGNLKIVIWGSLGIAGLLLAISRMRFEKRLDWRIGIGIPLFGVSLFVFTTELPQYGMGFSILGMLIMAGAALMSIKQWDEKVRIDRRERKLIDIITWANDITRCETAVPLTPLPVEELAKLTSKLEKEKIETIVEYHNRVPRANLVMRYQSLGAMRTRTVLMAKQLDEQLGSNLGDLAQQTGEKLEEHVKLGWKFVAGEISDGEYKEHWKSLADSAIALAEKAEETI